MEKEGQISKSSLNPFTMMFWFGVQFSSLCLMFCLLPEFFLIHRNLSDFSLMFSSPDFYLIGRFLSYWCKSVRLLSDWQVFGLETKLSEVRYLTSNFSETLDIHQTFPKVLFSVFFSFWFFSAESLEVRIKWLTILENWHLWTIPFTSHKQPVEYQSLVAHKFAQPIFWFFNTWFCCSVCYVEG